MVELACRADVSGLWLTVADGVVAAVSGGSTLLWGVALLLQVAGVAGTVRGSMAAYPWICSFGTM